MILIWTTYILISPVCMDYPHPGQTSFWIKLSKFQIILVNRYFNLQKYIHDIWEVIEAIRSVVKDEKKKYIYIWPQRDFWVLLTFKLTWSHAYISLESVTKALVWFWNTDNRYRSIYEPFKGIVSQTRQYGFFCLTLTHQSSIWRWKNRVRMRPAQLIKFPELPYRVIFPA